MILICAVAKDGGLGQKGQLLYNIPEDMKFFREKTSGKTVVMGQATLESLPDGKPLKNRNNIVMSLDDTFNPEGVTLCRSMDEMFAAIDGIAEDDVFVIGGATIYKLLAPYCKSAFLTEIDDVRPADAYLGCILGDKNWTRSVIRESEYEGISFAFCEYTNLSPKKWEKANG